jgi:hypothetical protein
MSNAGPPPLKVKHGTVPIRSVAWSPPRNHLRPPSRSVETR